MVNGERADLSIARNCDQFSDNGFVIVALAVSNLCSVPSGRITLRTSSVLNVESLDDFTARSIETNWFALIEA